MGACAPDCMGFYTTGHARWYLPWLHQGPELVARVAQMLRESGLKEAPAGRAKAPQPLPPPPPPAQMAASVVPLAAPAPLPKRGVGPRRAWGTFQQSPAAAESSRIKQQIFEARARAAMLGSACLRAGRVLLWAEHRAFAALSSACWQRFGYWAQACACLYEGGGLGAGSNMQRCAHVGVESARSAVYAAGWNARLTCCGIAQQHQCTCREVSVGNWALCP